MASTTVQRMTMPRSLHESWHGRENAITRVRSTGSQAPPCPSVPSVAFVQQCRESCTHIASADVHCSKIPDAWPCTATSCVSRRLTNNQAPSVIVSIQAPVVWQVAGECR